MAHDLCFGVDEESGSCDLLAVAFFFSFRRGTSEYQFRCNPREIPSRTGGAYGNYQWLETDDVLAGFGLFDSHIAPGIG